MFCTFALLAAFACQEASPQSMSSEAKDYLEAALNLIEKNSIKRSTDWDALRKAAYLKAANAQKTADTYEAIRAALASLGTHHSFLVPPDQAKSMNQGMMKSTGINCERDIVCDVASGSPAELAGVQMGSKILSINGMSVAHEPNVLGRLYLAGLSGSFTFQARLPSGGTKGDRLTPASISLLRDPHGRLFDRHYAYIEVPAFYGNKRLEQHYADTLQKTIRRLDSSHLKGWIIDLRRNGGGNMYPMIAGLGPILGEGRLGYFVLSDHKEDWFYRRGASGQNKDIVTRVKTPYQVKRPSLAVALLTGRKTASSGEITLISFLGSGRHRMFGEPTAGLTTGNEVYTLKDGAELVLTTTKDADKTGRVFEGPIQPNKPIGFDWAVFGTRRDPAVKAAISWLRVPARA